jgi:hypothetical protein
MTVGVNQLLSILYKYLHVNNTLKFIMYYSNLLYVKTVKEIHS